MNARDQQIANDLAKDFQNNRPDISTLTAKAAGGSGYIFELVLSSGEQRALKIYRPDQIDRADLLDGFEREGKELCSIRHQRIVRGYDVGTMRFASVGMDLPFYVMEYVAHDSLEKIIDQNIFPRKLPTLVNLFRQCLEALAHIHSLNIVHLDVKEGNLLVDIRNPDSPAIKLSDFGLCKILIRDDIETNVRGTWTYWPKAWQDKLHGLIPSNANRVLIRLARKDIPLDVDLHMLSVTFQRILDRVFVGEDESYWHRALSVILERMNWDEHRRSLRSEKYQTASAVLSDLLALERVPSLPPPLDEGGGLRVPVRSLQAYNPATRAVVDSPWFRRLRNVRQLGVAHLVYPGAVHSRFEHSIGAYAHALMYLKALGENRNSPWFNTNFGSEETKALAFTALVHDIGHYPFAHQLEDLDNWPRHELLSSQILDGSILNEYPTLEKDFGDPGQILKIAQELWGLDPALVRQMFSYCYRGDLPARPGGWDGLPKAWRAAAQIVNGPIDGDKLDYLGRDSHHCGVSYGLLNDPSRFLSSLTIAFDDQGTHLAVTEKGRVDAEFIPVIRYAMFSEVYWHHTVRSFTTMLRSALRLAATWADGALTVENLLRWSDDRAIHELRTSATLRKDVAVSELLTLLMERKPYARMYTLIRENNPKLYEALTANRVQLMSGQTAAADAEMIKNVFDITGCEPHEILWDIPRPGKDRLEDVRIADLHGDITAQNPGPLWGSLSQNFEQWVRKVRLFVHPKRRPRRLHRVEEIQRHRNIGVLLGSRFGI